MNRAGALFVVLVSLTIAGLILGAGLVRDPTVILPLTLELALLFGATRFVLGLVRDKALQGWLVRTVIVAIALRLIALVVVHFVLAQALFAPDAGSYFAQGLSIFNEWNGGPEAVLPSQWQSGYAYMNAMFFVAFKDPTLGMSVLNLFAGVWTVVIVFLLGRACFGVQTGKVAAILVAIFPSMILWSVVNIRDSITTFLVATIVLLAVRAYERVRGLDLLLIVGLSIALSTLRDYMGVLVLTGLAMGYVAALRRGRMTSSLLGGTVIVLFLFFALEQFGIFRPEVFNDPIRSAAQLRTGLQGDFTGGLSGSAFGTEFDTSTIGGVFRYLPLGLTYFLFAPFPWAVRGTLQLITLPEVLLWYALVPFTVVGFAKAGQRAHRASFLLVGVLLIAVTSYALVEGNFGSAYRHRAQVMPLFFVFSAHGLVVWVRRRRERSRVRQQRILDARARLLRPTARR